MDQESTEWWRPLAELVVVMPREAGYRYAEKPTDADLDRFEAESGIELAAGYRGFIKTFGPGVFAVGEAGLRIRSPYCPNELFALWVPRAGRESTADLSWLWPGQKPLFIFANDAGGHQYGWHPEEPRGRGSDGVPPTSHVSAIRGTAFRGVRAGRGPDLGPTSGRAGWTCPIRIGLTPEVGGRSSRPDHGLTTVVTRSALEELGGDHRELS